jgi:hypothetical protein
MRSLSTGAKVFLGSLAGAASIHVAMTCLSCSSTSTKSALAAVDAGEGGLTVVGGTLDVENVDCIKSFSATTGGSAGTFSYAEWTYPGKTAAQLSQVHAIGHLSPFLLQSTGVPPGYSFGVPGGATGAGGLYITDGAVAVVCGVTIGSNVNTWYDSVTFSFVR